MSIVRWDPVREVVTLRDAMDKLFQDAFVNSSAAPSGSWAYQVPVDVYQNEKEVVVKATLPGVTPENLQLTLEKGHLIIKGEVKADAEVEGTYVVRERRPGVFGRVIALPTEVEVGEIEASFANGLLTVRLPKAESVKPKQIKIRAS